jgi:hypothetical protein
MGGLSPLPPLLALELFRLIRRIPVLLVDIDSLLVDLLEELFVSDVELAELMIGTSPSSLADAVVVLCNFFSSLNMIDGK